MTPYGGQIGPAAYAAHYGAAALSHALARDTDRTRHADRFADRLEAERLAETDLRTEARLRAARLRVTDTVEITDLRGLTHASDPERSAETAQGSIPGAATLGEIPPARDDGRDGSHPGACRCPEPAPRGGIRPTPAGAIGLTLDQIG